MSNDDQPGVQIPLTWTDCEGQEHRIALEETDLSTDLIVHEWHDGEEWTHVETVGEACEGFEVGHV